MTAVWLRVRSDLRRRWRAWIGLALIAGFAAGAAMALAQAARRSEHAYRRFADHQAAADVVMTGASTFGLVGAVDLDRVQRSGFVEPGARAFVGLPVSGHTDDGKRLDATTVFPLASEDDRLGTTVEAWKMLAGRRANPADAHEAVASFVLADRLGLHVGSKLDLRFYRADRWPATEAALALGFAHRLEERGRGDTAVPDYADGPRVELTVVGIEASPAEFPPLITDLAPVLHLTPAFAHRYDRQIVGSPVGFFRLRPGRDLKSFQLAVERLAAGKPVSFVSTRINQEPKVQRSIHAEAVTLAVLAIVVALAGLVGVGQAMTRQTLAESEQFATLRSLGMRSRQLLLVTALRLLAIGALGAALAATMAIFLAQYALLPLARRAELDPGPQVDPTVLLVGVLVVMGLSLVVALWSARAALRPPPSQTQRARRRWTGAVGGGVGVLWVPTMLGLRYALQRAHRAVPAWATMVAVGLTIAVLAGTVTFTTNLQRLLDEPQRYGWNWDVRIGAPGLPDIHSFLQPTLERDGNIAALSGGTVTQIDLGKARIDVVGVDRIRGDALPTLLAGRAPSKPNEIALGGESMRVLHVHIGDSVEARIGTRSQFLRVVGQPVFPEFGDAGELGRGALMTFAGVHRLLPDAPDNAFLVRFRTNAAADGERLARAMEPVPTHFQARPDDLVHLSRGGGLLAALVVFLAVLGFALMAHALVTSVRSRRRELAVLRSLGLARRQLASIVLWQALTLAVGALVVGLVAGAVGGQVAWRVFARDQGVATDAIVSAASFVFIAAGSIAVALLAAAVPAWIAARSHPTRTLRAE